jgi:hypothetical protein
MTYTQQDLDDFVAFVPVMNGDGLRKDLFARFSMMGWLRQTSISPPRFELTADGQRQLDSQTRPQ